LLIAERKKGKPVNQKARLLIIGIVFLCTIMWLGCTRQISPDATSQPPASAVITTQSSSGTGVETQSPTVTNTLFPVYSVEPTTPAVTSPPYSTAEITVTLQISPEIVRVGDDFTVTLTATNTGQLTIWQTQCGLNHSIGNIGAEQPKDNPVFRVVSEDMPMVHGYNVLNIGAMQTCLFVLRAERPEILSVQGQYGGKVDLTIGEWYKYGFSTWHEVRIDPAVP